MIVGALFCQSYLRQHLFLCVSELDLCLLDGVMASVRECWYRGKPAFLEVTFCIVYSVGYIVSYFV